MSADVFTQAKTRVLLLHHHVDDRDLKVGHVFALEHRDRVTHTQQAGELEGPFSPAPMFQRESGHLMDVGLVVNQEDIPSVHMQNSCSPVETCIVPPSSSQSQPMC